MFVYIPVQEYFLLTFILVLLVKDKSQILAFLSMLQKLFNT